MKFYDQATTHTFSDWVVPYVFGVGVEDLSEFYLGALPDLSSFIQRSENSFAINLKEWDQIAEKRLTGFGKKLRKVVRGRIFIDLACGVPELSVVPRLIAEKFGASSYLGIDQLHVQDEVRKGEIRPSNFESKFVRQELFDFLSKTRMDDSIFLFVSGLEPEAKNAPLLPLIEAIDQFLKHGDYLLLGAGTPALDLPKKFKRLYEDPYHEFFKVRTKSWFF